MRPIAACVILLCLAFSVVAHADASCPAQGETSRDCPWAELAREILAPGADTFAATLEKSAPALAAQVESDSTAHEYLDAWGRSLNLDAIAKGEIVDPKILSGLYGLAQIMRPSDPDPTVAVWTGIQHAGIEHTYGYIFSLLPTPFGFKRARWVSGEIENGFGFSEPTFNPATVHGSLFANVTYFAGQIAFRRDSQELARLAEDADHVAPQVLAFDYSTLKPQRVEETVTLADGSSVTLRTDLVPFTHLPTDLTNSDSELLVYSVVRSGDRARIITAFPVTLSTVQNLIAPDQLGASKPITTQYNGYVQGLTGKTISGTRRVD